MAGSNWSRQEVEVVVSDYIEMLKLQLADIPYNKTEHRKRIMPLLNGRSHGSIERKHGNISAVLIQLGRTYIIGYKPFWNYQSLLREVIIQRIDEIEALDPLMQEYSSQTVKVDTQKIAFNKWLEAPPVTSNAFHEPVAFYGASKRDYIEQEQRNKSIGDSGEELVYKYEKWRLEELGKLSLVKKIEWVSREQGDGAGYDILSKNKDGSDRYIEVKSTTLGKETPIFFTKRENDFSENNSEHFHLYRVFNLKKRPKMYQCSGSFSSLGMDIEPMTFKGSF